MDEVGSRNQIDQLAYHRVGSGCTLGVAEDQAVQVESLSMAHALIRNKEKSLLLYDGAAETGAELVAVERWRLTRSEIEEVARVERIVAEELEQLTVELVGAGARRYVDDRAGVLSVLGALGRVGNLELLNAADRGLKVDRTKPLVVECDPVDQIVDRVLTIARGIDGERAAAADGHGAETVLRWRYRTG